MAEKKKRSTGQQILSGLNKGLVADFVGGPVDLATLAINAPINLASYAGQKMGLLDNPLPTIEKPFLGSDYIVDKMARAGMVTPDAESSLLEDAVRLGSGIVGPTAVMKAPQAAAKVGKAAKAAGDKAVQAGMRAEKALEPVVMRTMEKGGLPAQLLQDLTQGAQANVVEVIPKKLQGRKLAGLPDKVVVDGTEEIYTGFKPAQQAAERYMRDVGMNYNPPEAYVPVDVERARRIAAEYDKMPHAPNDPAVRAAYQKLADETMAQYDAARRAGVKFEFMPEGKDIYGNPRNALKDIYQNNRMYVFPTESGFGTLGADVSGNPLLQKTGETWGGKPVLVNDAFRAVHDYFGHAKNGVGFRAGGEENAWQAHASMFSPEARRALTSETRGQNSWLNYGPYGARNRTANTADTIFADQKTGLLPEWVSTDGYGGVALPRYLLDE